MKAVRCHFCSTRVTAYVALHRGLCEDCFPDNGPTPVRVCGRCVPVRRHAQRPITSEPGLVPQMRLPAPPRYEQKGLAEFGGA